MTDMELQKDDGGNYVMKPADFRLHVSTGEEADQQWPSVQVEEEVMPLLNMPEAWQMIIDEKELPAKKKTQGDLLEVNAKIMVKEISYHMLASTVMPSKDEDGRSGDDEPEKSDAASIKKDALRTSGGVESGQSRKDDDDTTPEEGSTEEKDGRLKSIYGASLLLKLQFEDKTPQKAVPHRTHEELGKFIQGLIRDLHDAMEKNEKAGRAVLDTLAFELTLLLLARYMEGIETGIQVLEDSVYELLTLCAEQANPREMCMPLRTLARKIDIVYVEATSYLILEPLLKLWTKLVLRIPRKRHYFLNDLVKAWERMFKNAESYELGFMEDDSEGVAKPGRIDNVWDILLDFLEKLSKVQIEHRETSDAIRLAVDDLGKLRPEYIAIIAAEAAEVDSGDADGSGKDVTSAQSEESPAQDESRVDNDKADGEKKASDAIVIDEETKDWVKERAATLARVLLIQGTIWNELQAPEGDERQSPHRKTKKLTRHARQMAELAEKSEHSLIRCHRLFMDLGWTNPALVCQIAGGELNLEPWSWTEELFREHIKHDVRSKKERKGTLYSMNSVGLYLCGVLRPRTRRLLDGKDLDDVDDYAATLAGTGFDLFDPFYALDLALPYLMTLIPDSTRSRSMGAIVATSAFLERIPDDGYESFDEVVRPRCSVNALGCMVNLVGLSQHLLKAVAGCDDPKHRRVAYETFQAVLRKVRHPHARYTIVECCFHDCQRVAVAGQLVTEMKDAVRHSDICAEKGDADWSDLQASALKTRYVEVILPTYFTPRKEMLMSVNAMVAVAGVVVWLGGSDKRLLERLSESDKLKGLVEKRMKFVKTYCKLGRECIRALAAVAEHDRKNMPTSQLARTNTSEAQAMFAASGRTLNQCMTALSLLNAAERFFEGIPIAG